MIRLASMAAGFPPRYPSRGSCRPESNLVFMVFFAFVVTITDAEIRTDTTGEQMFVVYRLHVINGIESWICEKRYSDFAALDEVGIDSLEWCRGLFEPKFLGKLIAPFAFAVLLVFLLVEGRCLGKKSVHFGC